MRRIFLVFAAVICLCGIIAAGVAAMGVQQSTEKIEGVIESGTSILQDTEAARICSNRGNCSGYADTNADGICDNRGSCGGYADADADGICDHRSNCTNRTNANADGSCDGNNRQTARYCGNGGHHGKK